MAVQYARQLADPSLVRSRFGNNNNGNNGQYGQNQAYPMQPQGPGFYPPPPLQHQDSNSWMVPPYPGPPQGQGVEGAGYNKSDYQPEAAWASAGTGGPAGGGAHREEEEAWERARMTGVTAHLTGQASPPPSTSGPGQVRSPDNTRGFVIPNNEEDEAWERARNEGPTAHLTGNGVQGRRTDGGNAI